VTGYTQKAPSFRGRGRLRSTIQARPNSELRHTRRDLDGGDGFAGIATGVLFLVLARLGWALIASMTVPAWKRTGQYSVHPRRVSRSPAALRVGSKKRKRDRDRDHGDTDVTQD